MGNGQVKTVEYADNVLALTDLKTQRIDAVVMDEVVAAIMPTWTTPTPCWMTH